MSGESVQEEKLAAGGVLIDYTEPGARRVLLVHRPRYDDWSFPKGKLQEGESLEQAALREVREETGLECQIISQLSRTSYEHRTSDGARRPKVVQYFLMRPVAGQLAPDGEEVDRIEWFDAQGAARMLSYECDRNLLERVL